MLKGVGITCFKRVYIADHKLCCSSTGGKFLFHGLRIKSAGSTWYLHYPYNVTVVGKNYTITDYHGTTFNFRLNQTTYTQSELENTLANCGCCATLLTSFGSYINDTVAGDNGVLIGEPYELAVGNPYGLPTGTVKIRVI